MTMFTTGGVISPVHDGYKKSSLISCEHRLAMARLAVTRADSWVRVSDWETRQEGWSRTRRVKIRSDLFIPLI